jgi:hypothetical protein
MSGTESKLQHTKEERPQDQVALALGHFDLLREEDRLRRADVPQLRTRQSHSREAELRHRAFGS